MATKARFWQARFWGAWFYAATGAVASIVPETPAPPAEIPTTGGGAGGRIRRPRLDLSFSPDELDERRFQARLPRLKKEDEMAVRTIKDFLRGIN